MYNIDAEKLEKLLVGKTVARVEKKDNGSINIVTTDALGTQETTVEQPCQHEVEALEPMANVYYYTNENGIEMVKMTVFDFQMLIADSVLEGQEALKRQLREILGIVF